MVNGRNLLSLDRSFIILVLHNRCPNGCLIRSSFSSSVLLDIYDIHIEGKRNGGKYDRYRIVGEYR